MEGAACNANFQSYGGGGAGGYSPIDRHAAGPLPVDRYIWFQYPPQALDPQLVHISDNSSVFRMDGQGAVGKSTHAGLPWLKYLRGRCCNQLHFWPFDGWQVPEGTLPITQVYPSLCRRRYRSSLKSIALGFEHVP